MEDKRIILIKESVDLMIAHLSSQLQSIPTDEDRAIYRERIGDLLEVSKIIPKLEFKD